MFPVTPAIKQCIMIIVDKEINFLALFGLSEPFMISFLNHSELLGALFK